MLTKILSAAQKLFTSDYAARISAQLKGHLKPGDKVLDIGSGTGFVAERITKDYQINIQCVDIHNSNRTNLKFTIYDGIKLPFVDRSFDVVLLIFVLHHCANPLQILEEAKRVCAPKGKIILMEDTYYNRFEKLLVYLHGKAFNWLFKINNQAVFYSEWEWLKLLKELNFQIVSYRRISRQITYPVSHILFLLQKSLNT